jgi:hypothetical protein
MAASLLFGCHDKESLRTEVLAKIPEGGVLVTNFVIPASDHVFILIGYKEANETVTGEVKLVGASNPITLVISTNSLQSNWLKESGMNAVLVNSQSITMIDSLNYQPGQKCAVSLKLKNAPPSAVLCVCYLK